MGYFRVFGYKPILGNTSDYYIASSESEVMSEVKKTPVDAGGFVNYSVEEIEELPPELSIECPSCSDNFISPDRVTDLCT